MSLHREGRVILILAFLLFVGLSLAIDTFVKYPYEIFLIIPLWIVYGFMIWFFRNPKRGITCNINDVIAPVDGKVVIVEEVYEGEYFKSQCLQLSIFMSPLNVHVTRYPVSGKVVYTKYHPGQYLVAFHPKSSTHNERTTVVVETENKKEVLFRQVAGAVARRIVMYAKEEDQAQAGAEYGFIKFGSRLDIYLPLGTEILVKVGDKTKGGVQKIAELK